MKGTRTPIKRALSFLLAKRNTTDSREYFADLNFIGICFAGGAAGVIAYAFYAVFGVPLERELVSVTAMTAAYFTFPFLLRTKIKINTLTVFAFLWMEAILLLTAFNFGGFEAPSMPWSCIVIVLAYYYLRGAPRWFVIGTMISGLAAVAALEVANYPFASPIPEDTAGAIYLSSALIAMGLISAVTHVVLSDSKRSHRRLKAAKLEAEEKQREAEIANASKTQFLATMSHELRTPLNAIIGFSDLIRKEALGPIGTTKYREYATDVHDSADHLRELIDDILDYARLDLGKNEFESKPVDIKDLFAGVLKQVGMRPEAKAMDLHCEISGTFPRLLADPRMVRQILLNLLVNALKFTKKGGKIVLRAEIEDDGGICLCVSDSGIGIPVEDIPLVTKPFAKSNFSSSTTEEGTGLGLAIVNECVLLHQGQLKIDSTHGEGTTIKCHFPPERTVRLSLVEQTDSQDGQPDVAQKTA